MLHVLVAFQVLRVFAVFQFFVHHAVGQLGRGGKSRHRGRELSGSLSGLAQDVLGGGSVRGQPCWSGGEEQGLSSSSISETNRIWAGGGGKVKVPFAKYK